MHEPLVEVTHYRNVKGETWTTVKCAMCGASISTAYMDESYEWSDASSKRLTARTQRVEPCGHSRHEGGDHRDPERTVTDFTRGGIVLVE